ncbi:MAG: CYTH domain-containing protein [Blautia sp.]|nr:CYTH domain-containing protein [Blautia sp.]
MEIERKWMVKGWPQADYPLVSEQSMRQGYVSVSPTVRIREEALKDGETEYILCFKSSGGLARREIEMAVPKDKFLELEDLIGRPLIPKVRRTFLLPDGHKLEVNHVDEGLPTEFWYAEIEYGSIEEAENWTPSDTYLETFLSDEVTLDPSQTMGAYWVRTRLQKK